MHNKIFETHAHYEDVKFDSDREELLASLPKQNIEYVINVGSNLETTNKSIELAKQYDYIYAAIGVHPSDVEELDESSYDVLEKAANEVREKTIEVLNNILFPFIKSNCSF